MSSLEFNILFYFSLVHIINLFLEYAKYYNENQIFQELLENRISPYNLNEFTQKNSEILIKKNVILEGFPASKSYTKCRLDLKLPISYSFFPRKPHNSEKYGGNLEFFIENIKNELPQGKKVKIFHEALFNVSKRKVYDDKNKPGFLKKAYWTMKSVLLDFFAFKSLTIGYEESEFVLISDQFLRVFGDISYNMKTKTFKMETKIIFSSMKNIMRDQKENLIYLEKKMFLYILMIFFYYEVRFCKAKHIISIFKSIFQKFKFNRKDNLINFNWNKIDLQTLKTNKNETKCIVCFERIREIIFTPCNHMVICERCLYNLNDLRCPMCRENILDIIVLLGDKKLI